MHPTKFQRRPQDGMRTQSMYPYLQDDSVAINRCSNSRQSRTLTASYPVTPTMCAKPHPSIFEYSVHHCLSTWQSQQQCWLPERDEIALQAARLHHYTLSDPHHSSTLIISARTQQSPRASGLEYPTPGPEIRATLGIIPFPVIAYIASHDCVDFQALHRCIVLQSQIRHHHQKSDCGSKQPRHLGPDGPSVILFREIRYTFTFSQRSSFKRCYGDQ